MLRVRQGLPLPPAWAFAMALCCGLAAGWLAVSHPLSPGVACVAALALALTVVWRPPMLAFLLPALLPVASLMPWTGGGLLDESDLLVLALAAGGYARWSADGPTPGWRGGALWVSAALVLSIGVVRGWTDATALHAAADAHWPQALHADHTSVWNTLRVSKAWLWCLLLAPLWWRAGPQGGPWLARGMVAGLVCVCAGVLWERALLVGLFDVQQTYRTAAWFWEMQVGGGAIDMYLAMALPFALRALCTARGAVRGALAMGLWWLAVYAVLTTFSRGVALAALILLGWMAWAAWRWPLRQPRPVRLGRATMALALLAVVTQTAWVVGAGHLGQRLERSDVDLRQRVAHWQAGLALPSGPGETLLGLGAGRLPARYAAQVPGGELPGRMALAPGSPPSGLLIEGPASRADLEGRWTVSQRVGWLRDAAYTARLRLRGTPGATLQVALCERHLLEDPGCRWQALRIDPVGGAAWHVVTLSAPVEAAAAPWRAPLAVLQLRGPGPAQSITVEAIELTDAQGRNRVRNGDFAQGMRHWMGIADRYYQPWHIDNLPIELLIERGVPGWLLCLCVLAWAVRGLWPSLRAGNTVAWALSGSLIGVLALGCVISVTEFPRLVVILGALLCGSAHKPAQMGEGTTCKRL